MQSKELIYYPDVLTELNSGNIRKVYLISANEDFLLNKFILLLQDKLDCNNIPEALEVMYADEIGLEDVLDRFNNFSSLFSNKRIILVKRCEKYKSLELLKDYIGKKASNEILIFVFDSEKVTEKKLWKLYNFIDFSYLEPDIFIKLITDEFKKNNCVISNDVLRNFTSNIPLRLDIAIQEIIKISNAHLNLDDSGKKIVTEDIILQTAGYKREYTIPELITSLINKNPSHCYKILNYLFEKTSFSEVYLISMISSYFLDLLCFKSVSPKDLVNGNFYKQFKIWGDRLEYARSNHHFVSKEYLFNAFKELIATDLKLKSTMVESKILVYSLIQNLLK